MLAQGMHLQFAHRTNFQWSNEGRGVAAVHCIIVGYDEQPATQPVVFDYSANIKAAQGERLLVNARINPYLVDTPDVVITRRSMPLCDVPEIGGNPAYRRWFHLQPEEASDLTRRYMALRPYVRRFLGADEFINGGDRYCLWLKDAPPALLREIPEVKQRVAQVRKFRFGKQSQATNELAVTPAQFRLHFTQSSYLIVPSVSSERRNFIPIGFSERSVIVSNLCLAVYGAEKYHFDMLCSTMHNAGCVLSRGV